MSVYYLNANRRIRRGLSWLLLFSTLLMAVYSHAETNPIGFHVNSKNGQIQQLQLVQSNYLFTINAQGQLISIRQLQSASIAKRWLSGIHTRERWFTIQLPHPWAADDDHKLSTTTLYRRRPLDLQNTGYYRRAVDKYNGLYNSLQSFDGVTLEYFGDNQLNRRAGIVGYVRRIGSVSIQYHRAVGRDRGKIKKIGKLAITYEPWLSAGAAAHYVGKFYRIGDITIRYYDAYDSYDGFQGSVRAIGKRRLHYFSQLSIPHPPQHLRGQFERVEGQDPRVVLHLARLREQQ